MARILPFETARTAPETAPDLGPRDPFDVVTFLHHFLTSDSLPVGLAAHLGQTQPPAPAPNTSEAATQKARLVMRLAKSTFAVTLGRG